MNCCLPFLVHTLLAAKPQPRPGDWSFGWGSVGIIAAVAIAIIAAIWLTIHYFQSQQQHAQNSPWRLFTDLCALHELTRRQRHVLTRLARQYQLAQPAVLFIEPKWWEADQLGPTWSRHLPELRRLRLQIFSHH